MIRSWFAAALGGIFLAGSTTGASMPRDEHKPMQEKMGSSTRQIPAVDVACVQTAVNAREATLAAGAAAQSSAVAAAYTARASALSAAYTGTDAKTIRANSKAAWTAFSTATGNAKKTWQRVRENAWNTFKTAAKACKGGETITDSSGASMEQQGN